MLWAIIFHKHISAEILGRFSPLKYTNTTSMGIDQQKAKLYTLFANIYYKFPVFKHFSPYIILGPGYTFNISSTMHITNLTGMGRPNLTAPGRNLDSFAWNAGFGSVLNINNNFSLDIGYRYMSLGEIGVNTDTNSGTNADKTQIKAHEVLLGIIYKFY